MKKGTQSMFEKRNRHGDVYNGRRRLMSRGVALRREEVGTDICSTKLYLKLLLRFNWAKSASVVLLESQRRLFFLKVSAGSSWCFAWVRSLKKHEEEIQLRGSFKRLKADNKANGIRQASPFLSKGIQPLIGGSLQRCRPFTTGRTTAHIVPNA